MARYKVLQSVAHNFAHSFVSDMNHTGRDWVPCYLVRASKATGVNTLEVNILTREASPPELLVPEVVASIEGYCKDFARLVTKGGAAMDMVTAATLRVLIQHATVVGPNSGRLLQARLHSTASIVDDRGHTHVGEHVAGWACGLQEEFSLPQTRWQWALTHLRRWWRWIAYGA